MKIPSSSTNVRTNLIHLVRTALIPLEMKKVVTQNMLESWSITIDCEFYRCYMRGWSKDLQLICFGYTFHVKLSHNRFNASGCLTGFQDLVNIMMVEPRDMLCFKTGDVPQTLHVDVLYEGMFEELEG